MWQCSLCGKSLPIPPGKVVYPVNCSCGFVDHGSHSPPSLAARAVTFSKALAQHQKNGRPRATLDEIEQRFEICKPCSFFDGKTCTHSDCGCSVNTENKFRNKLAWADQSCPIGRWGVGKAAPLHTKVTACITWYLREDCLKRLVDSIRRYYPKLQIRVQDTEGNLSWGRNRLVEQCDTPYYLMLEEDFEFTENTKLESLVAVLDHDEEMGGAGGWLEEKGGKVYWAHNFRRFRARCDAFESNEPVRVRKDVAYRPCDLLVNFGVFRTDLMRRVQWDENLPLLEHRDWYWRVSQQHQFRCAYVPSVSATHHRDRSDPEYARKRSRSRDLHRVLVEKHGFSFIQPHHLDRRLDRWPSVVVLGVGFSNTSLTVQQLVALGWHAGDHECVSWTNSNGDVEERDCWENSDVVAINSAASFNHDAAAAVLRNLPQPWVIKDPRFCDHLHLWYDAMAPYEPVLLYVTKDAKVLRESWTRRGLGEAKLRTRLGQAEEQYQSWPWRKLRLSAEDIGNASGLFAPDRKV